MELREPNEEILNLIRVWNEGVQGFTSSVYSLWKQRSKAKYQILKTMFLKHMIGSERIEAKEIERAYQPKRMLKIRRDSKPQVYRLLNECIKESLVKKQKTDHATFYGLTGFGKMVVMFCTLLEKCKDFEVEDFKNISKILLKIFENGIEELFYQTRSVRYIIVGSGIIWIIYLLLEFLYVLF
ncbi:MAG: hypothetical protein NDP13_06645 [Crenarchaeota archaeon]|nr:hypothetical protein [Thermoproteota archaeon]MCR8455993.1 hypothetical protein [Thermoproteota archaeon]